MYSTEILRKGIEYLDLKDREIIRGIILSNEENKIWIEEQAEIKRKREAWNNRYKVPQGITKKELVVLRKETQVEIDNWKARVRRSDNNEATLSFCQSVLEEWIAKKKRIAAIFQNHGTFGENADLNKAKNYPIEQLIDFNSAGFARCLWHDEKTGSLKWYPKRNKAHCFAGCGDFDSIDAYQKINGVDFNAAIRALS